ncbi:uncharacterized protein LOC101846343 [Aplysia californica]|uniref:Uncharacterized protein LOC101846343 n=1 Tax=Aplysia californica TaxID=6500 RepID=A0ABM0ZXY0_APLCA|nr:uncharacterized protein LOC101846343 [Aplysia californica]
MRLKKEVLKTRCKVPLHLAKFLNLSGLELVKLEKISRCENLRWLIARDNKLEDDEGLENLKQLWYLDLSNNSLRYIDTLSKFLALGSLVLSNNDLKWMDLRKLQYGHFLSISLHGNKNLDSDPYYRIHVIDSLPLIWELDGRLVTVTERLHVKQFFIDTEYTQHPVRHKLPRQFQTSTMKNIGTQGIVSQECKYIYSKFPMSETHTKHTDERRLKYLAHMVQEDIVQWSKELDSNDPGRPNIKEKFLDDLLENRKEDVERCNMVLLLLVISLEFQLPTALVVTVLSATQLNTIGSAQTMPLFLLPRAYRTKVIGVLINAAKVDRDNHVQHEGGLYPQLFMCLYYIVAQLTRISQTSYANMKNIKPLSHNSDYMALMASEVVSLMMQVPKFFDYLGTDTGVINLTASATGSFETVYEMQELLLESHTLLNGLTYIDVNQGKAKKIVLKAIQKRLDKISIKMSDIPVGDRYLALSDALPIKPLHSVVWASNFLTNGQTIPCLEPPILNPAREAAKPKPVPPKRGENVLLGPQVVGEISMLMEGDIGLVKIDAVPVSSGAVESKLKSSDAHFTFVDMKALCYAKDIGMWRPTKTIGDNRPPKREEKRYTIQSTDEQTFTTLTHGSTKAKDATPLIYTPRTKTGMVYTPGALKAKDTTQRPQSSAVAERQLSKVMIRRVLSAGNAINNQGLHNNSFAAANGEELDDLFPQVNEEEEETDVQHTSRHPMVVPISTLDHAADVSGPHPPDHLSAAVKTVAVINTDTLHLHDNVHHIRGLTPREDSARSFSVSATLTPTTNDQPTSRVMESAGATGGSSDPSDPESQRGQDVEGCPHHGVPSGDGGGVQREQSARTERAPTTEPMSTGRSDWPGDAQDSPARDGQQHVIVGDGGHHHQHAGQMVEGGLPVVGDGCPVCLANAQSAFLTSVANQGEGLDTTGLPNKEQVVPTTAETVEPISKVEPSPRVEPISKVDPNDKVNPSLESETSYPRAQGGPKMKVADENIDPSFPRQVRVRGRPMSSNPSGAVRLRVSENQLLLGRPMSAFAPTHIGFVTHPPTVVATGTSAKLNSSRSIPAHFKTDFQQQREEAWKSTTRRGKQRPHTAIVQRSSTSLGLQFPPPQRPTSPITSGGFHSAKPRLRVTRTENWLAGGRDLFWEGVRKRPKSGHVPGWKEGLPESMRKQRPKSAYVPSSRVYAMRPKSPGGFLVTSCGSCRTLEVAHPGLSMGSSTDDPDLTYFMPHVQQLLQQPPLRPFGSPVSFDGEEDPLPHSIGEAEIRSGLFIQGYPPQSIPPPHGVYRLRSSHRMGLASAPSSSYDSRLSFYSDSKLMWVPPRFVMDILPEHIAGRDDHKESEHCILCKVPELSLNEENSIANRGTDNSAVVGDEYKNDTSMKEEQNVVEVKEPRVVVKNIVCRDHVQNDQESNCVDGTNLDESERPPFSTTDGYFAENFSADLNEGSEMEDELMPIVAVQRPPSVYSDDENEVTCVSPDSQAYVLNGSKEKNVVYVDENGSFAVRKQPPFV